MRTPVRASFGRRPLRVNVNRQQMGDPESVPSPTAGWDAVSPLADMKPDRAVVLDNWFPANGYVEVRRGHQIHAGGMGAGAVETLMPYNAATVASQKLFAAANNAIYDITASGAATSAVTSLTNNRWQWVNFTVSGGHYLWICNGADSPRHYNGSSWATPSLSFTNFSASDVINVSVHKSRLWMVFKDSMTLGHLGVGEVAGTVVNFPVGALFNKGGYVVATATWTKDGGAGEDDLFVVITSEGQVAVYQGTDPTDADAWSLVGVFDLGAPIGRRCFTKVAGDVALINIDGVLPLSRALIQDRGATANVAITGRINNAMNAAARSYKDNFGWQLQPYPRGTYVLLNVPISEGQTQHQYVMNTLTGAWCRFTGQNMNCWTVFQDELYCGGNSGLAYKADQTALDVTEPVDAVGQSAYNYYSQHGRLKQWNLIQPLITTDSSGRPAIGISTDFKDNAVIGTPTSAEEISARYDSAIYDSDAYAIEGRSITDWTTIAGTGTCAAIHFRARTGRESGVSIWGVSDWGDDWSYSISGDTLMRINSFNVVYSPGGVL